MQDIVLERAITEAERFLKRAKEAKDRMRNDSFVHYGCKETAAVKRASMDLTRVLTELRKP